MSAAVTTGVHITSVAEPGADADAALALFLEYAESPGFSPCAPYYDNSRVGSDCFELELQPTADTSR